MDNLARELEEFLRGRGMDLVAFADLAGVPGAAHPRGIAVGVALEPSLVASLLKGPSRHYYNEYNRIYALQDETVESCAEWLRGRGYGAFPQSRPSLRGAGLEDDETNSTRLPHKTVARLAGLGWIGRCALLVTPGYGSAVRISSLTTDAPLPVGAPLAERGCGSCTACVNACPGRAVKGPAWRPGAPREEIYDAGGCKQTARALSLRHIEGLKEGITLCGKCIAVCPHTQKYLRRAGVALPN